MVAIHLALMLHQLFYLPVDPRPNEIALFWAYANTPANVIIATKPPLAIMHYPSMVFISGHLTEEFTYTEEITTNLVLQRHMRERSGQLSK